MILNILVCVFLLGMTVLWSTYGLFSAFLNLLVVLASGMLAFALWEPVAHQMLGMGWVSGWGLGLLFPFLVVLIALRLAVKAAVRKNLGFHPVLDQAGGACFGLMSGVLTAGIMVIGAGFMQTDKDLLGVQGYRLNDMGRAEPDKSGTTLWVPVDRLAGGAFEYLAAGSFAPSGGGSTLASAHPDVAKAAEVHRLAINSEIQATRTASPGDGVAVTGVYEMDFTPESAEWLLRRGAAYAVMRQTEVDQIPLAYGPKEVNDRIADRVSETLKAGNDPDGLLFDKDYLATVRRALGLDKTMPAEVALRSLFSYANDQVPGGLSSAKAGAPEPAPTQQLFAKGQLDAGKKIVLIDTSWDKAKSNAYDEGALRLSPTQIQLAVAPTGKAVAGARVPPVAWATPVAGTPSAYARRELVSLVDVSAGKSVGIYGTLAQDGRPDRLSFVFVVPKDATLESVQLRELRFPLGKSAVKNASGTTEAALQVRAEMARSFGHLIPDASGKPEVEAPRPAANLGPIVLPAATIDFSSRLPNVLNWANPVIGVQTEERTRDFLLISGSFDQERGKDLGQTKLRINQLQVPAHNRVVRLQLTLDQCQAVWGHVLDGNRGQYRLVLRAEDGPISAAGFIIARADQSSAIRIDPNGTILVTGKTLADLRPIIGSNDKLYVYYFVDELYTMVGFGLWDAEGKKPVIDRQYDLPEKIQLKKAPLP